MEQEVKEGHTLTKREKKKHKKQMKNQKLLLYGNGEDYRYRGPVGIGGLRIAAWVMIVIVTTYYVMRITQSFELLAGNEVNESVLYVIMGLLSALAIPCFILVKFSMILQKKKTHTSMIVLYLGLALILAGLYYVAVYHYGIKTLVRLLDISYEEALHRIEVFITGSMMKKISFNVFVDMLLWALFFYFIDYDLKTKNKKLIIAFRLCSILPILYIGFCSVYKVLFSMNAILLSPIMVPLLTTTPPLASFAFVLITLLIRKRKGYYYRIGGTEEGYQNYLNSNANSLHFSKLVAVVFLIVSLLDLLLLFILCVFSSDAVIDNLMLYAGVGDCLSYLVFIPLVLLFSYTKPYKNSKLDMLIPVIAMVLIACITIEGAYQSIMTWLVFLKSLFLG